MRSWPWGVPTGHTQGVANTPLAARRRRPSGSPFTDPEPREIQHFVVGDLVSHDRYGLGTVISVEEGIAVLVDFRPQRERIPSPYSKLAKL